MNSCIIFLWIVFVLLHNDIVQAQSTMVAAGGNAIGPTAQVSYTIGQVV